MPVSKAAREKVIKESCGYCELFHDVPIEGSMIVHSHHAGIGGMPEDADCNDPDVLLWGCKSCHDRLDGRSGRNQPLIVEFSRNAGVLEMVDEERRKISHDQIFFHQWPKWRSAVEEYPLLVDALRRRNEAEFDLAKSIAHFRPSKKTPELFRVCPEVAQFGAKASFRTFLTLIGLPFSEALGLFPIGDWLNSEEMDSVRGLDINAIDALRKIPEDDVERLMGLTAKLPEFWAEVDKVRTKRKTNRAHYWQLDEETGKTKYLGFLQVTPDVAEAFALIKGRYVRGGKEA